MSQTMNPMDAPSLKMGEMYCTIGNRRYNMLTLEKLEAKATVTNSDVPRLGSMIAGKKPTGLEVKLTFTVYKCSEMFDKLVEDFKRTGYLPTFEILVANDDQATTIGRSSKVYKDCVLNGDILLSALDTGGDIVKQELECYAMDFDTVSAYTEPSYM